MNIKIYESAESTKDDRRNQKYYRSCTVQYTAYLEGVEVKREHVRLWNEYEKFFGEDYRPTTKDQAVAAGVKELYEEERESEDSLFERIEEIGKRKLKPDFSVRYYNDYSSEKEDGEVRMVFSWQEHAERPSEIISEDEALAKFPTEEVRNWFAGAIEKAVEIANERERKLEIMHDTEALAKWIANASREEAEEAVNYEGRLEALKQEYAERLNALKSEVKAEAHDKAAGILDEWQDKHVEEAIEADYCEESTEHAPKFWQRYLREPSGGYKHIIAGGQPDNDPKSKIDPDEVF